MLEPTDAALDWIEANFRVGWSPRDPEIVAAEFNAAFGHDIDGAWIEDVIARWGSPARTMANPHMLTWAQDRYLRRAVAEGVDCRTATALLNARYGLAITRRQIRYYASDARRRGRCEPILFASDGRYPKGNVPANKLKIGEERVHRFGERGGKPRDPEIYVAVEGEHPYRMDGFASHMKPKRIVAWEEANGPVPKGGNIVHIDGDWRNCELDNLMCLTSGELGVLNRHFAPGELKGDRDARLAAILAARVKTAAHRREREANGTPKRRRDK